MYISELGAAAGVAPRSLRHYERCGLLEPGRDARGWRTYTDGDLRRVREIRTLIDAGIPTALVGRLLGARTPGAPDADVLDEVAEHLEKIDARVRCLARNRDALADWLAAQRGALDQRAG